MMNQSFCQKCRRTDHCCIFVHGGFCFVGIEDAMRISKHIKMDYADFLDYSPLPRSLIDSMRHGDPSLEGALRLRQMNKGRLLRLKTKKDRSCIFLDRGICRVYDVRPNVCRIYPFWAIRLLNRKIIVIGHDVTPSCGIITSMEGIDESLSGEEKREIIRIFRDIGKEDAYYRKNIIDFARKNLAAGRAA